VKLGGILSFGYVNRDGIALNTRNTPNLEMSLSADCGRNLN